MYMLEQTREYTRAHAHTRTYTSMHTNTYTRSHSSTCLEHQSSESNRQAAAANNEGGTAAVDTAAVDAAAAVVAADAGVGRACADQWMGFVDNGAVGDVQQHHLRPKEGRLGAHRRLQHEGACVCHLQQHPLHLPSVFLLKQQPPLPLLPATAAGRAAERQGQRQQQGLQQQQQQQQQQQGAAACRCATTLQSQNQTRHPPEH